MGDSDTLVTWDPPHFQGTSLQDYSPSSNMVSQINQVGMACVTPNHVPGLQMKYVMQQATLEQVKDSVLSDGDDGDNNYN